MPSDNESNPRIILSTSRRVVSHLQSALYILMEVSDILHMIAAGESARFLRVFLKGLFHKERPGVSQCQAHYREKDDSNIGVK